MNYMIYTVYDRKSEYCLPVFSMRSEAEAIRQFTQLVMSSETDVSKYPADFDLLAIAHLKIDTGFIAAISPPKPVINGLVALTAANNERGRYKRVLDGQLDIEDFVQPESAA